MATTNGNGGPKAYSYLRFSTPEQEHGDSSRRQSEAAREYAEREGLDLDDDLRFEDRGVSGLRGRNVHEGALGRFIEAVDTGRVRPGSYLLVESLDRLSRDHLGPALDLFRSILSKDVNIVTLSDSRVYTKDSLNNLLDLIVSLTIMSRANEESETKSLRLKASWKAKRERAAADGKAMTSITPNWLRLNKDTGEYEVIEDRAESVRRVYTMYLDGFGKETIARRLNEEGVPPLSSKANGWHQSYIGRVLTNEAVVGRFQPKREVEPPAGSSSRARRQVPDGDPIEGYYPAVIDDVTFARARQQRRSRKLASGPKGTTFSNLLSGLATCGMCGASMQQLNKGKSPKGNRYLRCYSARRKVNGCNAPAVRYEVPLFALLNSLTSADLDLRRILGTVDDAAEGDRLRTLRESIESIEGQLVETEDAVESLLASLEKAKTESVRNTLMERLESLDARKGELLQTKEQSEDELRDANHSDASRDDMVADVARLVREWNAMLEQSQGTDPTVLYDVNLRLNAGLKQIIESIAIARYEASREWIEGELLPFVQRTKGDPLPTELHRVAFQAIVEDAGGVGVSMAVTFRNTEDRLLIIYADPRTPRRYLAAAVWLDGDGGARDVELTVSAG